MPFKQVAEELGIEPRELLRCSAIERAPPMHGCTCASSRAWRVHCTCRYNQGFIKGLQLSSELVEGTRLQLNWPELEFDEWPPSATHSLPD